MSEERKPEVGSIGWTDLTVDDAEGIRDFYASVVGWKAAPVAMDGYDDFNMNAPASNQPVAGICHARGSNAGLPAQWLMYVVVEDIERSIQRCSALGGQVIAGPKGEPGQSRFCVIRDPAGAAVALYQAPR